MLRGLKIFSSASSRSEDFRGSRHDFGQYSGGASAVDEVRAWPGYDVMAEDTIVE